MTALDTSGSPTSMALSKSSVFAIDASYPSLSPSPLSSPSLFPSNRSDSSCVASRFTMSAGISSFSSTSSAVSSSSSFSRNQLLQAILFPCSLMLCLVWSKDFRPRPAHHPHFLAEWSGVIQEVPSSCLVKRVGILECCGFG